MVVMYHRHFSETVAVEGQSTRHLESGEVVVPAVRLSPPMCHAQTPLRINGLIVVLPGQSTSVKRREP